MTWTIHIAFSWSWWAFAVGIALGAVAGAAVMHWLIEDAILRAWYNR